MTDVSKLPDEETGKTDYYTQFKRNVGIEQLAGLPQREGYCRKGVITNYPAASGPDLVRNFDNHVKFGYRLVLSTEGIKDDRVFTSNTESRKNMIPAPIIGKTSDGFEYVVMEIENSKLHANMKERAEAEHLKYLQSTGANITKDSDGKVIVKSPETKFGN